jgi:Fe-S-cluster containining protein
MLQVERWENILANVASGQSFMDTRCASAAADFCSQGGEIFCGQGCSSCCTLAVNCTAAEALLVARALDQQQTENLKGYVAHLKERLGDAVDLKGYLRLHRKELGGCPFLDNGSCGVYSVRPISCRALLSSKESHWCAVDFSELSSAEKLAYMESLDREAVAFPMHYLACTQDSGQKLESQLSLQMLKEFGCSLYGSMPVLVYLFKECSLIDSFQKDADALRAVAASAGLDSPFLLQVDTL